MTEAAATVPPPTSAQKLSAEAIGTFVLILVGVGAFVASNDYAATGLAFGIAYAAMIYAFGRISGGHFNPAVSVGAALSGRISWREAGQYAAAQVVGGLVGGLVLVLIILAGDTGVGIGDDAFGSNFFGDRSGIAVGGALLIEIVMTFIFLMVVLAVTDTRNEHPAVAPMVIGLSLAAIHFASMWATGTSVNPARSLSVVLYAGGDAIAQIWLFLLAPLVGAALAGIAYPALFGHGADPVPGSGLNFSRPRAADQQASGYPQAQQAQPIIQDGWQWDPQAQQWIPAQQQPPVQPTQPQTQQTWPQDPGTERTDVRPPDGT